MTSKNSPETLRPVELEDGTITKSPKGRLTRRLFMRAAAASTGAAVATGSSRQAFARRAKLDTPTITWLEETQHTIFLRVCAGASGAPAGFSVQWQPLGDALCDEFDWPASDDTRLRKAAFSVVPGCGVYNLRPGECVEVEIGNLLDSECAVGLTNRGADELDWGTDYVFRASAHNVTGFGGLNKSDFTDNLCCSTEDYVEGCVFTQGYWRNHGPEGCQSGQNQNEWPDVGELEIGEIIYNLDALCTNLNLPGGGNAVRILSHQLIAALLNIANGATPPEDCDIDAASQLLICWDINASFVSPTSGEGMDMVAAAECLAMYNTGDGGVAHCPE